MPLDSYLPAIDNRRYQDIMDEVRTRIPRYTPEWTDLNDNDPGMAMLQVFAWMTDLMLFRLGRVPELNYLKFLQMIGIELRPAAPAQVEVTFPLLNTFSDLSLVIPAGTQVSAESDDGKLIVFETERALVALKTPLAAVQVTDGYAHFDATEINNDIALPFEPFGRLADSGSALQLGFKTGHPFPHNSELNLTFWSQDATPAAGSRNRAEREAYQCSFPETAFYPSAVIIWEYWDGRNWRSMNLLKDETRAFTRSGHVYLRTPERGKIQPARIGHITEPLYWIRARVEESSYERPPRLLAVRTNTVQALQAETVQHEVLGGSDGSPDQRFFLDRTPVLHNSLELEIDEGDASRDWIEKEDFLGSGEEDAHYVLNRTTGEIRFGGVRGSIPSANPHNPGGNIIARRYRFGGGKAGNVAAGAINALVTPLAGVDQAKLTNFFPAYGGRDEESLEEARRRAPRAIRSQCRAVSASDFEHLAMEAADIRRARALPLYHPQFPDVEVPGVMTVIVVPDSDSPSPMPSERTLRTVCAYLNQRRLLTTELYVMPPSYQEVSIHASLIADSSADLADVEQSVQDSLKTYFHPLLGGEDGQGWPFGGDIYYSLVYRTVLTVHGVNRIESLLITLDGLEQPDCADVAIEPGVLLYSTAHDVQVNYAFEY
jgi:predicted phage baseplate assembly protein